MYDKYTERVIDKPLDSLKEAIIDADHIPFITCFNKKGDEIKTIYDCIDKTDEYMNNIIKFTQCDQYVLALTRGKCIYRLKYYPKYKANRDGNIIPIPYSRTIRQYLIDTWGAVSKDEYEADDIVLSLNKTIPNSFIVSPDKDILNTSGYRFNPKTLSWVYTSQNDEALSFWRSMIVGKHCPFY